MKLKRAAEHAFQDARDDQAIRVARPQFAEQCKAVMALVQNNPALEPLGTLFSNTAKAWQRGFAILRQISKGRAPHDLADVVVFLCMCRAFSELLDFHTASDHAKRFGDDLSRWSLLLNNHDKGAYKALALGLWRVDVDLGPPLPCGPVDEDLLQYAQSLVSSLADGMRDSFGGGATWQLGLDQSQLRWRKRQTELQADGTLPVPADPEPPDKVLEEETEPGERDLPFDYVSSTSTSVDPKLFLAVTGAIFAALLVFLVCKFASNS
jgi:hypothetical protein